MMFLYLDSLFAEGREREVQPPAALPETWNRLYLAAMRDHARRAVFLHWWPGTGSSPGRWVATPDWRLDRSVIRLGLYLRERLGVGPGAQVAILSKLEPEQWIADFAILGLGAVSVMLDPTLPATDLETALAATQPVALLGSATALRDVCAGRPLRGLPDRRIVWGGADPVAAGASVPLDAALDFGGTLDTPERASAFRAGAREVPPEELAVVHVERGAEGSAQVTRLTQREVIAEVERVWRAVAARCGDLGYVAAGGCPLECRRAVYAFVGDGLTTTVFGSAAGVAGELAALRPDKLIAPSRALAALAAGHNGPVRTWPRGTRLWEWLGQRLRAKPSPWVGALGGRARWIVALGSGDAGSAVLLPDTTLSAESEKVRRKDGMP